MARTAEGRPDWMWLPDVALASVVSYLVNSVDYIRFSVVCKSWNSVAKDQKQPHMTTAHKQAPFLLLETDHERWNLYSVTQKRLYNFTLRIPFDEKTKYRIHCVGFSRGWLAFVDSFSGSRNNIILLNPFTQTRIHLPPITPRPPFGKSFIFKVLLSADPSLHPDDYRVAARMWDSLALIQPGRDVKWRIHSTGAPSYHAQGDVIFDKNGKWVYAITKVDREIVVRVNIDDTAVLEVMAVRPFDTNTKLVPSLKYFVETTNGDVLMILWLFDCQNVSVFKLEPADSIFVEVEDLNGDVVFIGSNSYSDAAVATRGSSEIEADCIYYWESAGLIRKFNVKDKSFSCHDIPTKGRPTFWIYPTVKL